MNRNYRKLTCVKDNNWYTIEWETHENLHWDEPTSIGVRCVYSGRPGLYADIEGSAIDMLMIADAIEKKENHSENRCAIEWHRDEHNRLSHSA